MPRLTASDAELIRPLPSGAAVVAVTDDGTDPRYAPVRRLAASAAHRIGGSVVFCVAPARDASLPRSRPRLFLPPVDGSVAGRDHTGTRSSDLLLAEARDVAAPGLTVAMWLPARHGPAGVAEAVAATGACLVLVPTRPRRRLALDRTLEYLAARVSAPVVAVSPDGTWASVVALGEPPDAGAARSAGAGSAPAGVGPLTSLRLPVPSHAVSAHPARGPRSLMT